MITSFSPLLLPPWAEERVTDIQFYFVVLIDIFYYGRGLGHTFGVRVDGTSSRRFLRFLSLTAFQAVGCGGGFAADLKKGARLRRGLCRRVVKGKVDGPPGRRLWPPVGGGLCIASLRGRRPFGPRGVDCPTGNEFYKPPAAVTSASSIIIRITTVHPFATSWPSSPKGDARSVTGLDVCVICNTISSATYFLVSP